MAVDKLSFNMFQQPVSKVNLAGGGSSAQILGGASGGSTGKNPFSGETVGLNTNLKPGDTVYTPAQAGKSAGISRVLYNA
jgi:hypothetical protein